MAPSRSACLVFLAALAMLLSGCTTTFMGPSILGITKIFLACIPEGTAIDTPQGSQPIEKIQPGDLVIGFQGDPVRVLQKHSYLEDPVPERFHRIRFSNGAEVHLCDMHRIAGIRARDLKPGMNVGGTTVLSSQTYGGVVRSYDLLTEDDGYRIQGVPVNSMIDEMVQTAQHRSLSASPLGRPDERSGPPNR